MIILLKKHKYEQYFGFFIAFMYIFGSLCLKMIAPRALLVLGNTDYEWLAECSNYLGKKNIDTNVTKAGQEPVP